MYVCMYIYMYIYIYIYIGSFRHLSSTSVVPADPVGADGDSNNNNNDY